MRAKSFWFKKVFVAENSHKCSIKTYYSTDGAANKYSASVACTDLFTENKDTISSVWPASTFLMKRSPAGVITNYRIDFNSVSGINYVYQLGSD